MEPDFSLMYSELGLSLDCSLEQFKHAYRRRIAELHPDRKGGDPPSPEAQAALLALISTYVAVNRFHRRYGRMPGATGRADNESHRMPLAARSGLPVSGPVNNGPDRPARPTWGLVILFVVLLALLASWDWLTLASQ